MNALLQHRGHNLMGAGRSIAVQNFNEQACILVMVGLYALMVRGGLGQPRDRDVRPIHVGRDAARACGATSTTRRKGDSLRLIADERRAQALGHWRLEYDRRVGNLVAPRSGARRMLRKQRR